jgi:hypothetical protein
MVVELVSLSVLAQRISRKMLLYAIPSAETITKELVQFVGKIVHLISEMMELFVTSLNLMAEVLDTLLKVNAKRRNILIVKRMVYSGILSVEKVSMLLVAVFAHLNAHLTWQILEFHAQRNLMEERLEPLLFVNLMKKKMPHFVTLLVSMMLRVMVLSVGATVLKEQLVVEVLFAFYLVKLAQIIS